ncbi:MAG TPA: AraC family transcriptional regulator [Armatimonadota bacterium]|jgi:AraC-like DNA-binding protein
METVLSTLITRQETANRTWCDTTWAGSWQNETFSRLYWLVDGEGVVVWQEQEFVLRPHRLYVIPGRAHYRYYCPDHMDIYWVHFSAQVFGTVDFFSLLGNLHTVAVADVDAVHAVWEGLLAAHRRGSIAGALEADGLLRVLLARFLESIQPESYTKQIREVQRFSETLDYIDRHLEDHLTLDILAQRLQLHPTYFANIFSTCFDEGPIAYVTRRRIERAQGLLWRSTLSIQAIANAVGFSDPFYFSRVFARHAGISPSQFRRRCRTFMP